MIRAPHREIVHGERGRLRALALHALEGGRERPALETEADCRMFRITIDGAPLLWARISSDHYGWSWVPGGLRAPLVAPMRADEARRIARHAEPNSEAWWLAWMHRIASDVGSITSSRRTPIVWIVPWRSDRFPALGINRFGEEPLAFEIGSTDWDPRPVGLVPRRPWPTAGDGRVKSYRKLARDGVLPPIVTCWNSALQAHLTIDGHARWIAAREENLPVPVLTAARVIPRGRRDSHQQRENMRSALRTLEDLASSTTGSGAEIAAVEAARIASRLASGPTVEWDAIDRGVLLDWDRWWREVRAAVRGHRGWAAADLMRR